MGSQRLPRVLRWRGVTQICRHAALLGSVISDMIQRSGSDVISRLDLQTEAERADECKAAANEPPLLISFSSIYSNMTEAHKRGLHGQYGGYNDVTSGR
jgi:hypothetical protein